ncbi:MAG: carboxylating nicotinate-nucleotide diphosphorylase [Bacteroidetes bacterium]|nr:MAG: carboxylating nicotinate-nucleotide diphosphorylase [Bacteroidota bacterium]REK00055.1 MAG: carboxylating nicotinate-nucleotide diphosphorylase [Bacteroidota bacterium]REK33943.1 MAG: carboxylating nicotinate-nucleotide diphosphorylase [Bacteroidota bacterium]REK47740.1 MAG: carboxylating nicotinate-nucleotide diphosphorylase [Bacteroidota bacterium]
MSNTFLIPEQYKGLSPLDFIKHALMEDIADGDHTSLATIPESESGKAAVKFKEDGILCGIDLAEMIFSEVDNSLNCICYKSEGERIQSGTVVMEIYGNTRSLLSAERLVLNCMQRMSGIATNTSRYVREVEGSGTVILDTRKTTPNFRMFEKMAVKTGGGENHRFGLFDMILIKDNHVDAAGGIKSAIQRARQYLKDTKKNIPVEIETRNLTEVNEVMECGGVNRIMLDNFSPEIMKEAVKIIGGKFETEASGGINLDNIRKYAFTGVNYISVGALTHSSSSLDISMKLSK